MNGIKLFNDLMEYADGKGHRMYTLSREERRCFGLTEN